MTADFRPDQGPWRSARRSLHGRSVNAHRWLIAALVATSLASCGRASDDATTPVPADSAGARRVLRDLDVGGSETHVFLPDASASEGVPVPVVIMLHGTAADRSKLEPLAAEVAESGALVYVPTWPVIDQVRPYPEHEGDEPYRRQSEAVICVLRDVKRTAGEFGGDPGDVTLVGASGGGMVGARVAIVAEPPWPGIDCDAGIDHRPERFIGLAGDYEGLYQYATPGSELYGPYDVLTIEPTNRELDVWLLHGQNDESVDVRTSGRFADHLAEAGIEARVLTTDSDHIAPLDMSTPAGKFTAARITAIVHGQPEPQWWPGPSPDATLTLALNDRCSYAGPETWPVDRATTIRLENATDLDATFAQVSVRSDFEITREEALASRGTLDFHDPEWLDWAGLRPVPAGETRTLHFAFVEADQSFVLYCHREPTTDQPHTDWIPAALVVPSEASTVSD
jgi:acetyl esterase/lipase